MVLNAFRTALAEWLNTSVFENAFIFLDLWSFLHLVGGFLVAWVVTKVFDRRDFLLIFFLFLVYEGIEIAFILSGSALFRPEPFINIAWDLIVGMVGAILFYTTIEKLV